MRRVWALGLVIGLAAVASAASADPVRIGFAAESVDYAPAWAAEKLGLFKKAGVDVKLITFRGGAAAQEALSAGSADIIAYFSPAVALAVSKGAREKMVATVGAGHVGWNVIVKADSGFKTVKDLAGKKVGISAKATTSDMAALWVAENAGVKFQEIPLGAALAPALRSGQVDAIVFSAMITMREVEAGQARLIARSHQGDAADLGERLHGVAGHDRQAAAGAARDAWRDLRGARLYARQSRLDARPT